MGQHIALTMGYVEGPIRNALEAHEGILTSTGEAKAPLVEWQRRRSGSSLPLKVLAGRGLFMEQEEWTIRKWRL